MLVNKVLKFEDAKRNMIFKHHVKMDRARIELGVSEDPPYGGLTFRLAGSTRRFTTKPTAPVCRRDSERLCSIGYHFCADILVSTLVVFAYYSSPESGEGR